MTKLLVKLGIIVAVCVIAEVVIKKITAKVLDKIVA